MTCRERFWMGMLGCLWLLHCASPKAPIALVPESGHPPPRVAPIPPVIEPSIQPPAEPRVETVPELQRFYAALRALSAKGPKRHVRVYWLGDSHGAADFWSGRVRSGLQERFGDGGPGFVHLGYRDYRHDGVKFLVEGKWRMRPKRPVHIQRQGDGIYGIGGLLMGGYRDSPRVEMHVEPRAGVDELVVDFCYRLKKPDEAIDVAALSDSPVRTSLRVTTEGGAPQNNLAHHQVRLKAPFIFSARPTQGSPDFCGAHVETDPNLQPGVVLDTLSINGARYATALAWDEEAWVAEASRKPPDLVILEYGTNEAGGSSPPFSKIEDHLGALLGRVRRANKDVDCVVVSATDRADAEAEVTKINTTLERASGQLGCLYLDVHAFVGGQGAMARLREEPRPKAQADGIHFTIEGYRELGAYTLEQLLRGYAP